MGNRKAICLLEFDTLNIIKEYETIIDAAKDLGVCYKSITRAIKESNGTMKNKKMRFRYGKNKEIKIPVVMQDYETGQDIQVYECVYDAAFDNDIQPEGILSSLRYRDGVMRYKKMRFRWIDGDR